MNDATTMQTEEKNKKITRKCPNNTHTLRHVLGSNPGGRFPLGIGSICKTKKWKKEEKNKIKGKPPTFSADIYQNDTQDKAKSKSKLNKGKLKFSHTTNKED